MGALAGQWWVCPRRSSCRRSTRAPCGRLVPAWCPMRTWRRRCRVGGVEAELRLGPQSLREPTQACRSRLGTPVPSCRGWMASSRAGRENPYRSPMFSEEYPSQACSCRSSACCCPACQHPPPTYPAQRANHLGTSRPAPCALSNHACMRTYPHLRQPPRRSPRLRS